MKRNKIILNIFLVFIALTAFAQQEADSVLVKVPLSAIRPKQPEIKINIAPDVIIKTNGNLFQCKIIEVNDAEVRYKLSVRDTSAAFITISRGEVYAIAYGNGLAMVITPELMGREADMYPKSGCKAWVTFKENLGKGSLNVGIGFVSFYSPIKNSDSYVDEQVMPSVFAGYTFIIKEKLKAGVHLGIGGNELAKSGVSEYDQMKINSTVEEGFFCLGIFCRYDILDGAIKPFIKGGIDFLCINMTTTSVAESLDGKTASLKTVVHQKGIKPGLILRAGLDIYLGDRFGVYADAGTGISLVQVGFLFNLE